MWEVRCDSCRCRVFVKLGSAEPQDSLKGGQEFRVTKMRNGGRILLAVLNLYAQIEIFVVTFDSNHSVTDSTQIICRCFNP